MAECIVDITPFGSDERYHTPKVVGELVRCPECEYSHTYSDADGMYVCRRWFLCVHDDDFCSKTSAGVAVAASLRPKRPGSRAETASSSRGAKAIRQRMGGSRTRASAFATSFVCPDSTTARGSSLPGRGAMAREIRAPEQVTGFHDRAALMLYARAVAVSVAAWLEGYAEGMADAVRPMAEWYRRHVDWGKDD